MKYGLNLLNIKIWQMEIFAYFKMIHWQKIFLIYYF